MDDLRIPGADPTGAEVEAVMGRWKACASVDGDFFAVFPDTGKMEFPVAVKPQFMRGDVWREIAVEIADAHNARLAASSADLSGVEAFQHDDYVELHRLLNFADDDSRQFTRWNMLEAVAHGRRLAASSGAEQRAAVLEEVAAERARQVAKGFNAAHDDEHGDGEIARQASISISPKGTKAGWARPSSRRDELIKGIALAVAEVERMDRALASAPQSDATGAPAPVAA